MVQLRCESEGMPDASGIESEGRKHLVRLYPVLVKSVGAASRDEEVRELVQKCLEIVGGEFGV